MTIDTWGWQIEAGSVATAFQTATGTLQGELAACQRYYFRSSATTAFTFYPVSGSAISTTSVVGLVAMPVTMRTSPTVIDFGNVALSDGSAITSVTTIAFDQANPVATTLSFTVASGLTQFRPYRLISNNNAAAYFGLGAEL
jgi:hypothetical protein